MTALRPIEHILDLARWAPSGDNTQPWRFKIISDDHLVVHGFDTREHCVFDLTGQASQIAIGGLLETVRIAATGFNMRAEVTRIDSPETRPTFDIWLKYDSTITPSILIPFITKRAVQRRPMRTRALDTAEKRELEASVGLEHSIAWLESWRTRLAAARLMFRSAKIRLTTPEAYQVHRTVIEWNTRFSDDKIPDQAVGLDPITTRVMQWAMHDWSRVNFLNTYLGGTFAPRIQLDFVPSLACAAHFLLVSSRSTAGIDAYIAAGAAMQRFWLTATRLRLNVQPEMTPLIFSVYARDKRRFSVRSDAVALAGAVRTGLQALIGADKLDACMFMGRIGAGPSPLSRSMRMGLDRLILN